MDSSPSSPERRKSDPLQFLYRLAGNLAMERGVVDSQYDSKDPAVYESELRRNLVGDLARNFLFQTDIVPNDRYEATSLTIDYSEGYEVGGDYALPDTVQLNLHYPYGAKKVVYLMREAEDRISGAVDIEPDESVDPTNLSPEQRNRLFDLAHHFDARRMLQGGTRVTREDMDEAIYALGQL